MKLTRKLRENSRVLILIVMAMLLVVFLIQDVIHTFGTADTGTNEPVAQVFGRTVRLVDLDGADQALSIAAGLRISLPPVNADNQLDARLGRYLLMAEAEQLGIRVPREQVVQMLEANQVPGAYLENLRDRTHMSLDAIYDAIGRVVAARNLFGYQLEAAVGESLPRMEQLYQQQNQNASVELSVIDDKALLRHVGEPTEEQLVEHFEKYKDKAPAHSESELAFGYRIPDRVRVEILTVDPAEIQTKVRISKREAQAFYDSNRQRYMKSVEGPSPEADAGAAPPQIQMTFEEAEPRVREDARAAKAIEEAQRLVNEMYDECRRGFDANAATEPSAGLFAAVAAKYAGRGAVARRELGPLDQTSLRREPGIGRAQATVARQTVGAADLAFRVVGLVQPAGEDDVSVLKVNEPAPVLIEMRPDAEGQPRPYQAYLMRVTQALPAGPPDSLEEVRDQVTADWKLARAHELAGEHARALADAARRDGLKAAVEAATQLKELLTPPAESEPATPGPASPAALLGPTTPPNFRRQGTPIPNVGLAPELSEKVFAIATQPAGESGRRVVCAPVAKNFKWVVAELREIQPMYLGDFDAKRATLQRSRQFNQQLEFMQEWGDFDNICARTGMVSLLPKSAGEPEPQ